MAKKNTTFNITPALKEMETELLKRTDYPATVLHKKAIREFYESTDWHVLPDFFLSWHHPGFIRRDFPEHVYVDDDMQHWLTELSSYNNCSSSIVFCHALLMCVTRMLSQRKVEF